MMSNLNLLKQVRIPTINLPLTLRRKMWRGPFFRSYLVVFLAYVSMYLIRKNFNISQNELIQQFGFTKTQLGQIGFWFAITYGVGKTVVSYLGDGRNTKNFVSLLLIFSALSMLAFGSVTGSLTGMIFFYALNGLFQSAGGPSSYSTITKWTARKNRGTFLGLWNMSHNVGGAMAAMVATYGAQVFFDGDVRGMFIFPACIALLVGISGLFMGSDSPEAYGLGKAEELFEEKLSVEDQDTEELGLSKWQMFIKYVWRNPFVWALCLSNVFVYIIRIGVDQWGIVYAKEVLGLTNEVAKTGFTLFETGALFGTLLFGVLSDLSKGRRALVAIGALLFIFVALYVYQNAHTEKTFLIAMFSLGFLIFGPQLLIGVSGVGFVPKAAIGVSDGVKGTFGYLLGDTFAKLGMGMMADNKVILGLSGWSGTFTAMYVSAFFALLILTYVAYGEEQKIKHNRNLGIH